MNVEQALKRFKESMLSTSTKSRYQEGIDAVQTSPMEMAASDEATQNYLQSVQASVTSGRRQAALRNSSFPKWKEQARGKGADRLSSGATTAVALDKQRAHFQRFSTVYDDIKATAATMPRRSPAEKAAIVQMSIEKLQAAAGKTS